MIARIFPYAALNYMCFEQYKRFFLNKDDSPKFPLARLLAGSLAGATSVFFTCMFLRSLFLTLFFFISFSFAFSPSFRHRIVDHLHCHFHLLSFHRPA